MDYAFEREWKETTLELSKRFEGEELDLTAILFLVGLQELQLFDRKWKKDEKVQIMHIGVCSLLIPFGFYEFVGRDEEGWPHFEKTKELPALGAEEQERLMKEAIIKYFKV